MKLPKTLNEESKNLKITAKKSKDIFPSDDYKFAMRTSTVNIVIAAIVGIIAAVIAAFKLFGNFLPILNNVSFFLFYGLIGFLPAAIGLFIYVIFDDLCDSPGAGFAVNIILLAISAFFGLNMHITRFMALVPIFVTALILCAVKAILVNEQKRSGPTVAVTWFILLIGCLIYGYYYIPKVPSWFKAVLNLIIALAAGLVIFLLIELVLTQTPLGELFFPKSSIVKFRLRDIDEKIDDARLVYNIDKIVETAARAEALNEMNNETAEIKNTEQAMCDRAAQEAERNYQAAESAWRSSLAAVNSAQAEYEKFKQHIGNAENANSQLEGRKSKLVDLWIADKTIPVADTASARRRIVSDFYGYTGDIIKTRMNALKTEGNNLMTIWSDPEEIKKNGRHTALEASGGLLSSMLYFNKGIDLECSCIDLSIIDHGCRKMLLLFDGAPQANISSQIRDLVEETAEAFYRSNPIELINEFIVIDLDSAGNAFNGMPIFKPMQINGFMKEMTAKEQKIKDELREKIKFDNSRGIKGDSEINIRNLNMRLFEISPESCHNYSIAFIICGPNTRSAIDNDKAVWQLFSYCENYGIIPIFLVSRDTWADTSNAGIPDKSHLRTAIPKENIFSIRRGNNNIYIEK